MNKNKRQFVGCTWNSKPFMSDDIGSLDCNIATVNITMAVEERKTQPSF